MPGTEAGHVIDNDTRLCKVAMARPMNRTAPITRSVTVFWASSLTRFFFRFFVPSSFRCSRVSLST